MKIPSGGDDFRIPSQPPSEPSKPAGPTSGGPADAARRAEFDKSLAGTGAASGASGAAGASGVSPAASSRTDGPQAAKLREMLQGVDRNAPDAQEKVADALVEWTLTERFGEGIMKKTGIVGLRASVQQQILEDPTMERKIKQILEQI